MAGTLFDIAAGYVNCHQAVGVCNWKRPEYPILALWKKSTQSRSSMKKPQPERLAMIMRLQPISTNLTICHLHAAIRDTTLSKTTKVCTYALGFAISSLESLRVYRWPFDRLLLLQTRSQLYLPVQLSILAHLPRSYIDLSLIMLYHGYLLYRGILYFYFYLSFNMDQWLAATKNSHISRIGLRIGHYSLPYVYCDQAGLLFQPYYENLQP